MIRRLNSLGVQFSLVVVFLVAAIVTTFYLFFATIMDSALTNAAQARQETSLRVLLSEFEKTLPGIRVDYDGHNLTKVVWDNLTAPDTHDLVDEVGLISGETATLFGWDDEAGDFIRLTTNIVKPDGARAVGTYLGVENPVHAAMMRGETYQGEAVILGLPYLTIYQPIFDTAGKPVGIFYVGVARSKIDETKATLRSKTKWLALAVVIVAIGVTGVLARVLQRPLKRLDTAIDAIRDGQLHLDIPATNRPDQIGSIARSVEELREALAIAQQNEQERVAQQEVQARGVEIMRHAMRALADRNLAYRIPADESFPKEQEALRQDFNVVAETLSSALSEIVDVSDNLRDAAVGVDDLSSQLSRRVETQAATLEETAAALQELAESGREVSEKVNEANSLAASSTQLSRDSGEQLESAVQAMDRIEKASEEIDTIVDLIEDIAFQTNLLALNAGVEAARAGTAGKGFAVVATEVRGLAQRASASVGEIRNLIQKNLDQVKEGSQIVQGTGTSINKVLEMVYSLDELIGGFSNEVKQQAQGLNEVNIGMRQIEEATQKNAVLAGQAQEAGDGLKTNASQLRETVKAFRFDEAGPEAEIKQAS